MNCAIHLIAVDLWINLHITNSITILLLAIPQITKNYVNLSIDKFFGPN